MKAQNIPTLSTWVKSGDVLISYVSLYAAILEAPSHVISCTSGFLASNQCVPLFLGISREKLPLLPNQHVCRGQYTVSVFFLPWWLLVDTPHCCCCPSWGVLPQDTLKNVEFLGQQKGAGSWAAGRDEGRAAYLGLGPLFFYSLYFHRLAVILGTDGVEV